jgi:hypothetical protein
VKSPAFSEWNEAILLHINIHSETLEEEIWTNETSSDLTNTISSLIDLFETSIYSNIEEKNKQFVMELLKCVTNQVNSRLNPSIHKPLLLFFKSLLHRQDKRFGNLNIAIGTEHDDKPKSVLLSIECTGNLIDDAIQDPQVIGQLLGLLNLRLREQSRDTQFEIYAVLTDGLRYRFFIALHDKNAPAGILMLQSRTFKIGQYATRQGLFGLAQMEDETPSWVFRPHQDLEQVVRILFNILQADGLTPLGVYNTVLAKLRQANKRLLEVKEERKRHEKEVKEERKRHEKELKEELKQNEKKLKEIKQSEERLKKERKRRED